MIREGRTPSFTTATKIARVLVDLPEDGRGKQFIRLASASANPFRRVEFALRADAGLDDAQAAMVMDYYLAVRAGRLRPRLRGHSAE